MPFVDPSRARSALREALQSIFILRLEKICWRSIFNSGLSSAIYFGELLCALINDLHILLILAVIVSESIQHQIQTAFGAAIPTAAKQQIKSMIPPLIGAWVHTHLAETAQKQLSFDKRSLNKIECMAFN